MEKTPHGKTGSSERQKPERDLSKNDKLSSSKDKMKELEMFAYENDEEAECEENDEN